MTSRLPVLLTLAQQRKLDTVVYDYEDARVVGWYDNGISYAGHHNAGPVVDLHGDRSTLRYVSKGGHLLFVRTPRNARAAA